MAKLILPPPPPPGAGPSGGAPIVPPPGPGDQKAAKGMMVALWVSVGGFVVLIAGLMIWLFTSETPRPVYEPEEKSIAEEKDEDDDTEWYRKRVVRKVISDLEQIQKLAEQDSSVTNDPALSLWIKAAEISDDVTKGLLLVHEIDGKRVTPPLDPKPGEVAKLRPILARLKELHEAADVAITTDVPPSTAVPVKPIEEFAKRDWQKDEWQGLWIPDELAYRIWTIKGAEITARVDSIPEEGVVILHSADGRRKEFGSLDLSDDDREFVGKWKSWSALKRDFFGKRLGKMSLGEFTRVKGIGMVEFQVPKDKPIVKAMVGGEKVNLMVDTGATSKLILKDAVAKKLAIQTEPAGRAITWQGSIEVRRGTLDSFTLGPYAEKDFEANFMEGTLGDYDGIIGHELLATGEVAYDFAKKHIFFRQMGDEPSLKREPVPEPKAAFRTWRKRGEGEFLAKLETVQGSAVSGSVTMERANQKGTAKVAVAELDPDSRAHVEGWELALKCHREFVVWMRDEVNIGEYYLARGEGFQPMRSKLEGRTLLIDVSVNGEAFEFFIDSGAGDSSLSLPAYQRRRLRNQSLGPDANSLPVLGWQGGAEGKRLPVRKGNFSSFKVGPVERRNHVMGIYDFAHLNRSRRSGGVIDGVIGVNELVYFKMILDYRKGSILIQQP